MTDVTGRTVVITGASSGTGRAAARALHRAGARVLPIGGSRRTVAPIAAELDMPPLWVDLESLDDVERIASELKDVVDGIDVLILNAGAIVPTERFTPDGIEANLQVNAISHWWLLQMLANRIDGGRVVATSSQTHKRARVDLDHLNEKGRLGWHGVYARAKLVQGLLLREFARRRATVDVGDFHPGAIASRIGRHLGSFGGVVATLAKPLLGSPQDGAARMLHLVQLEEPLRGRYFEQDHPHAGSPHLNDRDLAERVWDRAASFVIKRDA